LVKPCKLAPTESREAFGVRRIPALSFCAVQQSKKAPEYGALQTLRAQLPVCFSFKAFENLRENGNSLLTLAYWSLSV